MTAKPPHDTVRQRKKGAALGAQRYLPIAEIRNDTVILKNGGLRAILRIEATNFNLKSETEQEAIIAGYGAFLNTLSFPIQIIVRSTHINIDTFLAHLQSKQEQQKNQLLQEQTALHIAFIRRLLEVADIMQKSFYLVLPLDRNVRRKTLLEKFLEWLHPEDSAVKAAHRNREFNEGGRMLNDRVELAQAGLNSLGLHARRLTTRELIQLYYDIYNPQTSQHQKLPQDIADLHTDATTL